LLWAPTRVISRKVTLLTKLDTYLCLFTFAIHGTLSALIDSAEDIGKFLTSTLSTISSDILSDISSAQNAIVSAVDNAVNDVGGVLGAGNINIPQIQIPSVSLLSNITVPDTVLNALQTLNNSIPTFDQVKNDTDGAISFPFELLKVALTHDCLMSSEPSIPPSVISRSTPRYYPFLLKKTWYFVVTILRLLKLFKNWTTWFNTY
jgi:hypothetical protein